MATIDRRGASVDATDPPIATDPNPGLAIKAPCRVTTTAAITLAGLQTVDGVALAAGDRVLVTDQADAKTNGLYNASTGNWTRTIDANSSARLASGMLVPIIAGTTFARTLWQLTSLDPVTLDSSSISFAVLASSPTTSG